jgi:bifunctional oligoribonuclease and PAP phosphatase NrnA
MKSYPQAVRKIIEQIRASKTICVVGHVRPDGDCIGSQLALSLALKAEGKKVSCWNEDPVPDKLRFLDPDKVFERPRRGEKFDCVIAADCASFERLGKCGPAVQDRKILINIDHHQSNTRYGDINWISAREASTGELIFKLLKAASWPITPKIADCLFTAVSTDTGSFQYATTKPMTYNTAGELVKRGANLAKICDEVYQSYPMSRVKLLKHLYNKFRLTYNDQIAYLWLKKKDFARTGARTPRSPKD